MHFTSKYKNQMQKDRLNLLIEKPKIFECRYLS